MTFQEWWDSLYEAPKYSPLDSFEMQKAYEAGWNALADLTDGPTYEEVMSHAND